MHDMGPQPPPDHQGASTSKLPKGIGPGWPMERRGVTMVREVRMIDESMTLPPRCALPPSPACGEGVLQQRAKRPQPPASLRNEPMSSAIGRFWIAPPIMARFMAVLVFTFTQMAFPTLWAQSQSAPVVGEVIFVSHDAWTQRQDNTRSRLNAGDKIRLGDILETASDAQLHLKMIDDAFIALRPGARLHIRDYRPPTPDAPDAGIKLELMQGSMRSVTGHIGESHKTHFRLNTPIAAIGIRGTDFSLRSTPESAQASVSSGAILMSSFSAICSRDALGPCLGENSLAATASAHSYIELRAGAVRPAIVQAPPVDLLPTPEEERSRSLAPASGGTLSPSDRGVSFTLVAHASQRVLDSEEETSDKRADALRDDLQTNQPTPGEPANTADTDRDGLDDHSERLAGTNPFKKDTDSDGMPDGLDSRPNITDVYTSGRQEIRLSPQQLAAFQFDSIHIRRSAWGAQPALIEHITLTREASASDTPGSITVERRQDQEGNVFWGSAASFGLLEEAMRADPAQAALSQELREALLKSGVSPEEASLAGLQWLQYHRNAPSAATVADSTRYLVATQGLERASTPLINQHFPAFNLPYTMNVQDAARNLNSGAVESLPVIDFQFKMNHADQTFTAKLTLLDPRPGHPDGRTDIEFRGAVNESGMIFGGNDQGYLKGFFLNEMRQIAFIFERQDDRGILGGAIVADQDTQRTDTERLQPRMALYQTESSAPVLWGRWDNFAQIRDADELNGILNDTRELIAYNNTFALMRPKPSEDITLPTTGTYSFDMAAHEAVVRHGQSLELAQVHNPSLDIHFDKRTFDTHLDLTAPSLAQPVAITATGSLGANGVFSSDPTRSNSTVAGFLDPAAVNAGMLFERNLDNGALATGVVQWKRH